MILLVVSAAEELEGAWVSVVANCFQNHVVSLLNSAEANVLHGLNERQSASVGTLGLLLQMHGERGFVIDVVAGPQVHGEDPEDAELGHASPDVGHLVEQFGAAVFVEVSVAEHG